MPELGEILSGALDGVITAVETAENSHLLGQVTAVEKLNGKKPGVDDVKGLLTAGWLPDFFAASEITVDAQLTMTTERSRDIDAKGTVTFGPIALTGGLSTSLKQGTNTNVGVTVTLERQSRNSALQNAFTSLATMPVQPEIPKVPSGSAALPTTTTTGA